MFKERPALRLQLIILATLLVLAYIGIVIAGWDDSKSEVSSGGPEIVADQKSAPTPFLLYDYQAGEVRIVGWTQLLFEEPPLDYTGESDLWAARFHIHDNDVVEILGPAELLDDYWYWPIRVLQGGIYPEGGDYWVPDDGTPLFGPTKLTERPVPPFSVGEEVRVSYNFCVRAAPAGPTLGDPCHIAYGGFDATIIEGPTFADGRYWCMIERKFGPTGWVSCEFAKK